MVETDSDKTQTQRLSKSLRLYPTQLINTTNRTYPEIELGTEELRTPQTTKQ